MGELDDIAAGGGLAGTAFALELGARERAWPSWSAREAQLKVCGDFLSVEARQLLAYLGLDLPAMGCPAGSAGMPLPFAGAGLSRICPDEALLGAAEKAGRMSSGAPP